MPWYQAPTKINLGLWVGARDELGYHPVDTIMQGIAFYDQLYLKAQDHMRWESTGSPIAMDDQNLVVRAYAWAKQRQVDLPPIYCRLEKVTWVSAGLGGGSSDAAALIRWAFHGCPVLQDPHFLAATAELGMDVPFFVRGGTARAQGHGQRLSPVRALGLGAVVLANPGVPLSTADVYRAFDAVGGHDGDPGRIDRVVEALEGGLPLDPEDLRNDLEEAAFRVMPRLKELRDLLRSLADGKTLALSGSGPTYYILGSDEGWADWMARRLIAHGVPRVQPTTVSESW